MSADRQYRNKPSPQLSSESHMSLPGINVRPAMASMTPFEPIPQHNACDPNHGKKPASCVQLKRRHLWLDAARKLRFQMCCSPPTFLLSRPRQWITQGDFAASKTRSYSSFM